MALCLLCVAMNAHPDGYKQADTYRDLRGQALGLDSRTLESRNGIFALLMETGHIGAVVTVVATSDGGASIYFSNGGGLIGAGEFEQVREVVIETLSEAEKYANRLEPVKAYPLPKKGDTRFYLVTSKGVLSAEAPEELLGNEQHELSPLFYQVQKLIAYIRAAQEYRQKQKPD